MRIVIVGPGAIGCLFAALLTKSGHSVVLLDKDPTRAQAISQHGLRIETDLDVETLAVPITACPRTITEHVNFLCICVKAYDTGAAIRHALPLASADTTVVCLQNGLGNAEQIAAACRCPLVCAVTSHGSTVLGPGSIRHAGSGPTAVAPAGTAAAAAAVRFAELLEHARIEVVRRNSHQSMLWSKVAVNAAINPVTALNNVPNGAILDRPEIRSTAMAAAGEAAAVAAAAGIALYFESVTAEVEKVCSITRNNISSMLQDVRAGRRTEIKAISGAIVARADELDVDAPVNRMLLEKVSAL